MPTDACRELSRLTAEHGIYAVSRAIAANLAEHVRLTEAERRMARLVEQAIKQDGTVRETERSLVNVDPKDGSN